MDSAQLGLIVLAAILTAALAGLATLGALLVGLRHDAERRRAERLFAAAGRVLESLDTLRVQLHRNREMAGAIVIAKSRVLFHIAELRGLRVGPGLELALGRLEDIVVSLTNLSSPATIRQMEHAADNFQDALVRELPRR